MQKVEGSNPFSRFLEIPLYERDFVVQQSQTGFEPPLLSPPFRFKVVPTTRISRAEDIAVRGLGRVAKCVVLALALIVFSYLSPVRSEASRGQIDARFGQHGFVFSSPALSTLLGGVEVVSDPDGSPTVGFGNGALHLCSRTDRAILVSGLKASCTSAGLRPARASSSGHLC